MLLSAVISINHYHTRIRIRSCNSSTSLHTCYPDPSVDARVAYLPRLSTVAYDLVFAYDLAFSVYINFKFIFTWSEIIRSQFFQVNFRSTNWNLNSTYSTYSIELYKYVLVIDMMGNLAIYAIWRDDMIWLWR